MTLQRETIFQALLTTLQNSLLAANGGLFQTVERRLRIWEEVSPAEQPALYILERDQRATQLSQGGHFGATRWILEAWLFVYCRFNSQQLTVPSTQINNLLDAIESALLPAIQGQKQNLGQPDLVTHCWIEGNVFIDEGVLDQQAVVVVPVLIATGNY